MGHVCTIDQLRSPACSSTSTLLKTYESTHPKFRTILLLIGDFSRVNDLFHCYSSPREMKKQCDAPSVGRPSLCPVVAVVQPHSHRPSLSTNYLISWPVNAVIGYPSAVDIRVRSCSSVRHVMLSSARNAVVATLGKQRFSTTYLS